MHHILGNKVLEYDVDDRGVIVDEREIDRTVNPKPNIADWVKEHMVFWYDMSKPVDVYVPGVTYANPFVNDGGKLTYDNAINKCIITHTPTNNNNIAFWQIIVKPLQYVESYKIRVTGLPEGFTMKGRFGYVSIQITSDGEYDIPEYKNSSTTNSSYPGFYLAGDNVNDVDCNIVVEEIPTKQSVPTNEILKANPYLQDFSGNNRPLKLNNFLFAAMSGVDGYNENFLGNRWTINQNKGTVKIESSSSFVIQAIKLEHAGIVYRYVDNKKVIIKCNITGITEEIKGRFAFEYHDVTGVNNIILENGYFEFITSEHEGLDGWYGFKAIRPIDNCNIIVTQIPEYPGALVTDGVDDYGQVQNLQQGVKVLFYTCNPFSLNKILYDQTKQGWRKFNIYNQADKIAYNERNENGVTYIDGNLNSLLLANDLVNKKHIITIVNDGADESNTISPIYFSVNQHNGYFANLAFYNSFGFNSVPTKETDGFTEQDLINYVLENLITK